MALTDTDRSIAGFTMAGHGLVHWFETSIPILLVVWLDHFDVPIGELGLVVALGYAPFGLGALPGGILADRYGPKRLVLTCLAGMSLAFVVIALSNSLVGIAVGLVCWGVAASVYHPAGLSLISTGVEDRGTVFAWHGIAGNVGLALGPFVAATLLIFLEWQLVAALLALPGIVALAYGLRVEFDPVGAIDGTVTTSEHRSLSALLANSRALFAGTFALVFVIVTFEGLFYRGTLTYLPEVLHGLPAVEDLGSSLGVDADATDLEGIEPADYVYVGLLVVGMAGQYAGGKLTRRVTPARGLVTMFVALAVLALVFVPVSDLGVIPLLALCALLGFFLFAIQPFYQEGVAVHTPPDARGLSYGYTYLGEFGLGAASVAIGGFVLGSFALWAFFAVLAGFAITGATLSVGLLYVLHRRDLRRVPVESSGDE